MANKLPTFIQSGTSNYRTPVISFNRLATDLITPGFVGTLTNTSGVAPQTGSFAINAQGTPNMSVAVSLGQLYMSATPSGSTAQTYGVTMDATENVTISSNSTGSTVYDFIYMKLDTTNLNNPAVDGLNVASFFTSRSTTASVDSNGAQANSLLIGEVAVANNAVSISNANITDRRIQMSINTTGWINANETHTYLSATTVTVPSGALFKYAVGDKYRIFQAGALKYFYITGVTDTVLTIFGGTDYTLTNTTINQPSYSHAGTPIGFPGYFNSTNAGAGAGSLKVSIQGREMKMWGLSAQSGGIAAAGTAALGITFPIAFATAPAVTFTVTNHTGSVASSAINPSDPTTTAAVNAGFYNISGTTITAKISWIAIGTI